MEVDIRH